MPTPTLTPTATQTTLPTPSPSPTPGPATWTRQFGTGEDEIAYGAAVDESANLILVGYTGGVLPGQSSVGKKDAVVRKYDTYGDELWTRQFGTRENDVAYDVAVDLSGDLVVAGQTYGNLPGQKLAGEADAFLRKYNSSGNELWTQQFGTAHASSALSIAVDGSKNVYVAGTTRGVLPGPNVSGSERIFVRKYDGNGREQWTRQFGSPVDDSAVGVEVDAIGNVYIAGETLGSLPGQTLLGGGDAFLRKYDTAGNELWTRQFGTDGADWAGAVALDGSGNVYVAGGQQGLPLSKRGGTGSLDALLRKYDADGNELWTRQFGTTRRDFAFAVAVDTSDNVFVVGGTEPDTFVRKYDEAGAELWTDQIGFPFTLGGNILLHGVAVDGSGSAYITGAAGKALDGQTGLGGWDALVRKYNPEGYSESPQTVASRSIPVAAVTTSPNRAPSSTSLPATWTRQFGGSSFDAAYGVAVDGSGNVFVAGSTIGVLPCQPPTCRMDAFLRKYDIYGNELWTRQFGSPENDGALDVAVDGSGNAYVVGQTRTSLPDQTSAGHWDAFLRKYDTEGKELWTRQFGSTALDVALSATLDGSGNVYVAGETGGVLLGKRFGGSGDIFVRKYDEAGNEVWTRQFADTYHDGTTHAVADASGNVYVFGKVAAPSVGEAFKSHPFVWKFDPTGREVWTLQFGTATSDSGRSIAVDSSGHLYVAGVHGVSATESPQVFLRMYNSQGDELWSSSFELGFGTGPLGLAAGVTDDVYMFGHTVRGVFIRKYDNAGGELWTRQFGIPLTRNIHVFLGDVAADQFGNLYAVGRASRALPGQTAAGHFDAIVRKYDRDGYTEVTLPR